MDRKLQLERIKNSEKNARQSNSYNGLLEVRNQYFEFACSLRGSWDNELSDEAVSRMQDLDAELAMYEDGIF